jgi:hypothetical protein
MTAAVAARKIVRLGETKAKPDAGKARPARGRAIKGRAGLEAKIREKKQQAQLRLSVLPNSYSSTTDNVGCYVEIARSGSSGQDLALKFA